MHLLAVVKTRVWYAWFFFLAAVRSVLGFSSPFPPSDGLRVSVDGGNIVIRTPYWSFCLSPDNAASLANVLANLARDLTPQEPSFVGRCNQCRAMLTDGDPYHTEADGFVLCLSCHDQVVS